MSRDPHSALLERFEQVVRENERIRAELSRIESGLLDIGHRAAKCFDSGRKSDRMPGQSASEGIARVLALDFLGLVPKSSDASELQRGFVKICADIEEILS